MSITYPKCLAREVFWISDYLHRLYWLSIIQKSKMLRFQTLVKDAQHALTMYQNFSQAEIYLYLLLHLGVFCTE